MNRWITNFHSKSPYVYPFEQLSRRSIVSQLCLTNHRPSVGSTANVGHTEKALYKNNVTTYLLRNRKWHRKAVFRIFLPRESLTRVWLCRSRRRRRGSSWPSHSGIWRTAGYTWTCHSLESRVQSEWAFRSCRIEPSYMLDRSGRNNLVIKE